VLLGPLAVRDLGAAIARLTGRWGFAVDLVTPADDPSYALLARGPLRLALRLAGAPAALRRPPARPPASAPSAPDAALPIPALVAATVVSRADASAGDAWVVGRAGMRYRDLLPGRFGGRFIASHIAIPDGGPVPDWVHFHRVRFQMISCVRGWVRVVYEDQGEPFVMREGDCVLQPPQIRHRVLESSPGLEVLELGCPASHETWADRATPLPTATRRPERVFGGQRFVRHEAAATPWRASRWEGVEMRDTGIGAATAGLAGCVTLHAVPGAAVTAVPEAGRELWFAFVTAGACDAGPHGRLGVGDALALAPDGAATLRAGTTGMTLTLVTLPA
jgi:quercetin dioxygenase-like cupin family protein